MTETAKSPYNFKEMLFVDNPFDSIELDGIEGEGLETDVQGWGSNHGIFKQAIKHYKPATVIELGTWKGASAIHMAGLFKEEGIAAQILCVDNFIGFPSYYLRPEQAHKEFKIKGGIPRLYWTFMKNVHEAGHADMITPLVQQTAAAAQICMGKRIKADMIYVDGDHTYEGCRDDLKNFTPVLNDDGFFICDDYQWDGAKQAMHEYIEETGCNHVIAGNKVVLAQNRDLSELDAIMKEMAEKHAMFQARKKAAAEAAATENG